MNPADIDISIFFLINAKASNILFDILMPALSARGYLLFAPIAIYILWNGYKGKRTGADTDLATALWTILLPFISFLLADWLGNELKVLIGRVRPCNALQGVHLLVGASRSGSMPSNHASNTFAAAAALWLLTRKNHPKLVSRFPLLLACSVGFSRVYVGVHYPSDVLAGALLGATVALISISLYGYAVAHFRTRPQATLLVATLAALSLFRVYYILHGPLDLSADEAHYWEWSRRLDLSYYSKGPMVSYLIYLGTSIFGDTVFGIRIMAVACSALSSILLYKLTFDLYKNAQTALYAALLFQILPLFAPFGVLFTIDSPFILFWILSLNLFWKIVMPENAALPSPSGKNRPSLAEWGLFGLTIGLGLLTKYTMAFFLLSAFLFLFFSEKRPLLRTTGPYLAILTALFVFSPVIIWNMQHNWVTVRHTAGQAKISDGLSLSFNMLLDFLGSQIGLATPLLFLMMSYAIFRLYKSRTRIDHLFLLCFSAPILAFFLLKSLQGKVQANWALTGYITLVIAFCRFFLSPEPIGNTENAGEKAFVANSEDERRNTSHNLPPFLASSRLARSSVTFAVGLALFVTVVGHYPGIIGLPLKYDTSRRLRGHAALGREVSKILDGLSDKGPVLIFSDKYQLSSLLAFYVKGKPRTYCISLGRRMDQYDLWPGINAAAADLRRDAGTRVNGIYVTYGDDLQEEVISACEKTEKKLIPIYENNTLLRKYSLLICYNFKGMPTHGPETY